MRCDVNLFFTMASQSGRISQRLLAAPNRQANQTQFLTHDTVRQPIMAVDEGRTYLYYTDKAMHTRILLNNLVLDVLC